MTTQSQKPVKRKLFFRCTKRLFDTVVSFIALIILLVPMLIISIIICIDSRGCPFFVDLRVGKYGHNIKVLKFRTMVRDAETNIDHYLTPEQKEQWIKERKLDNDPRVTRFGHFLRKTSIDELPQFWNILVCDLSIVGPRPITRYELEHSYNEEQQKILLSVKPGLTGEWQVYGREDAEFDDGKRQELELRYVQERSFLTDLKIIILTVPAVLKHKE